MNGNQHYFQKNDLGSIAVITDQAGNVVQAMDFDPWGKRRNIETWDKLSDIDKADQHYIGTKPVTTRGFTGHEMLDEVGLIHMNGRIYDDTIARFVQADPIIQDPFKSQSLNRYSYAWNNPLNATDPSGFNACSSNGGSNDETSECRQIKENERNDNLKRFVPYKATFEGGKHVVVLVEESAVEAFEEKYKDKVSGNSFGNGAGNSSNYAKIGKDTPVIYVALENSDANQTGAAESAGSKIGIDSARGSEGSVNGDDTGDVYEKREGGVYAIEAGWFGYAGGIFLNTNPRDLGVYSDSPTNHVKDLDVSDVARKLFKVSAGFTYAPDRRSFDADTDRFNANLLIISLSTDQERTTATIGIHIPFPVTEVESRTISSFSVRELFNAYSLTETFKKTEYYNDLLKKHDVTPEKLDAAIKASPVRVY